MKISIITVTFNSGTTLRDTIESVLGQCHQDIEYIVVDGKSTDNTVDIIREYEPKFNGRMKWVSERDKGLYDAMNKGISMSTGEIVGMLNSDDFYTSSDILSLVVRNMADVDAVYGDVHYVNNCDFTKCVRRYSSKGFKPWKMIMGFMPAHPSFYCRRAVYSQYGLFDLDFRVAADFELLLRFIYLHKIKIKYLPVDFVTMRTGGVSSSGLQSHKKILKDHMLAYKKNKVRSNYFFEGLRYAYKIVDIGVYRLKH